MQTTLGDFYFKGKKEPQVEVKRTYYEVDYPGHLYRVTDIRFKVGGLWRKREAAQDYLVKHYDMGCAAASHWLEMQAKQQTDYPADK